MTVVEFESLVIYCKYRVIVQSNIIDKWNQLSRDDKIKIYELAGRTYAASVLRKLKEKSKL
jgi:hypothetical protein